VLCSCFTSIRLHRGLSPPGCWTCPAHNAGLRPPPSAADGVDRGPAVQPFGSDGVTARTVPAFRSSPFIRGV
jgi:hypothetical protein